MILSKIYSDGMIIQRNKENIVEGETKKNTKVKLDFANDLRHGNPCQ